MRLTDRNRYTSKDQLKSDKANQYIGLGVHGSATDQYRKDWGELANTGKYTPSSIIFVSINGNSRDRFGLDKISFLLDLAIEAGSTFITDTPQHRQRPYNIGEREVAMHLKLNNYTEVEPGTWVPIYHRINTM